MQPDELKVPCNSWKCQGEKQVFVRDRWAEPFSHSTPIGPGAGGRSGVTERAYCTNCNMYAHVPITDAERDAYRDQRTTQKGHMRALDLTSEVMERIRAALEEG